MEAESAERLGKAVRSSSRDWRDDAALLKTVSSWLRLEQFRAAVTAWVIALRSAPLLASSPARALAACCFAGSEGEGDAVVPEGDAMGADDGGPVLGL
jgi:hypothetical protein